MATELLFIALATWRLSLLLVDDSGPYSWFSHAHLRLQEARRLGLVSQLLDCMRCTSFWCALGLYGLWQLSEPPVIALAIWGGATALEEFRTKSLSL